MTSGTGQLTIAPSILSADLGNLQQEVASVEQAGADWLHIDVMDGSFVPPITFGDNAVAAARKASKLFLDVHLMIVQPERQIERFAKAGANLLTVHQETCPHLYRTLSAIKAAGMKAGVSINPGTPVSSLCDVIGAADLVLIMTVNPGWGGQTFIQACLEKITAVRKETSRRNLALHLEVDGGINPQTARACVQAGADVLVSGSFIFGQSDRASAITALRNSAA